MTLEKRVTRELHVPVFLPEVVKYLACPKAVYLDGTLGDGGHASALLNASGSDARLIGIDLDTEGLIRAKRELEKYHERVLLFHDTFANLRQVAEKTTWYGITGILFDLGMSTHHLQAERGFSFKNSGNLDMRFDLTGTVALPEPNLSSLKRLARKISSYTAKDLLNLLHEDELAELIAGFGEEVFAERIAAAIVSERRQGDIISVPRLTQLVVRAYPVNKRHGRLHVATKTFQALRIAVNREYETLQIGIGQALDVLKTGGKLAVISFHSGEDRIVKQLFKKAALTKNFTLLTKHPIKPVFQEVRANVWSRSAKLRVIEKTKNTKL